MTTSSQVNYMYGAYVNIKPIVDMDLQGLLGADELLIFSYIMQFSANDKCKKFLEAGNEYYMFSPQLIIKQLPILNTKTDKGVKNKINKLIEAGLLAKHNDNQRLRASYYCFGIRYAEYKQRCKTLEQKDTTCNESSDDSSNKSSDTTCNKSSDYNSTIHNNTNNNSLFGIFWESYPNKVNREQAKKSFNKLSDKDKQIAIESAKVYGDYLEFEGWKHPHASTFINQKRYLEDYKGLIKNQRSKDAPTEYTPQYLRGL